MIGGIDKEGHLMIQRKGVEKAVCCPFVNNRNTVNCGDWCAKFEEPHLSVIAAIFGDESGSRKNEDVILSICHNQELRFKKFIDERENEVSKNSTNGK